MPLYASRHDTSQHDKHEVSCESWRDATSGIWTSVIIPTITNVVNLALRLWSFSPSFQTVDFSPLLKKSTLDNDQLSNYRPISNLSLISKIIERVVKSRLIDHLFSHNLLNPHQSAYRRHHSTETSLLYTHDHLINAVGSQKLSCLCLLDLYGRRPPLVAACHWPRTPPRNARRVPRTSVFLFPRFAIAELRHTRCIVAFDSGSQRQWNFSRDSFDV